MPGKMLVKLNQQPTKIFVVVQGRLELFQNNDRNEEIVAVCGPGMYTGELNVLSGRRSLVSIRAAEAGELIEIEREALRTLVQTDSQLSDIFLRAFILRRLVNSSRYRRYRSDRLKSFARHLSYQRFSHP
jgi:thioredoxin reductase (NADPH)